MCGFVGILNKNGNSIRPEILRSMADTIHYRGPDEEGMFLNDHIGFHHKRLSIIDLKTGQQPMTYRDYTIVFNGEIYNYIELRNELITKGHHFTTTSDTEVILHAYHEYGDAFVDRLNGMFAFIIYDQKNNRLYVARDHFGIKPLYWYHDDHLILFGSEVKAILKHPGIKAEPATEQLYEYLTFQFIIGEGTMFRNIFKIQSGHYLTIDLDSWKMKSVMYWDPNFETDMHHTEQYFITELKKILDDTIMQQMRSDVAVGTYLSGGTDSSLVTIMSAKHWNNP